MAVNAPFGLTVKNNEAWFGRYDATDGAVLSTNLNPSIAYKVADKLSLGGGLDWQWFNAAFTQSINQSFFLPGAPDATARFEGHDWGFGYNMGLLYKPWQGTRVGVTYRSKIEDRLKGGLDFSPNILGLFDAPASTDWSLPASTDVSVTQVLNPKWSVSLGVEYTQWSTFQQAIVSSAAFTEVVNFRFNNTWMASAGATYHWNDAWTLRGGVGWDQSPVDNLYRTVSIPDQDRYMVGVGFGYKINEHWLLDGSYAHYFATNASINGSINNSLPPAFGTTLNGTYQLSLDYVALSVRYKF
jgi:long-chain fatty acid transport protein